MTTDPLREAEPFKPWEGDHTDLVHVLWGCKNDGLTLRDDYDAVATRIMRSRWFRAALAATAPTDGPDRGRGCVHCDLTREVHVWPPVDHRYDDHRPAAVAVAGIPVRASALVQRGGFVLAQGEQADDDVCPGPPECGVAPAAHPEGCVVEPA